MNKIKILVCDDMPQIRRRFIKIINRQNDMEVIGEAPDSQKLMELIEKDKPDIILMDIQMESEEAGIDATEKILQKYSGIKVIVITVHKEDDLIFKAYAAGAVDYIIKTATDDEIVESIHTVYENEIFIRPNMAKKILTEFSKMHKQQASIMYTIAVISNLTNAELEILKLVYNGKSRADIADERNVELVTINTQIRNILKKLGYRNTKELISFLKQMKIFEIMSI